MMTLACMPSHRGGEQHLTGAARGLSDMFAYLIRRLLLSVFVIIGVMSVTFFMLFLSGDPVATMLYQVGATQKDLDDLRHALGYDRPLAVQYVEFLFKAAQGDFGKSIRFGQTGYAAGDGASAVHGCAGVHRPQPELAGGDTSRYPGCRLAAQPR